MDLLQSHYRLPFTREPLAGHAINNKNAQRHSALLWQKMLEWEAIGAIQEVGRHQLTCINPLSVAEQYDTKTNSLKLRVCLDASRYLNDFLPDLKVKISHLTACEEQLQQGDWQECMDLSNMFFHVKLHKSQFR